MVKLRLPHDKKVAQAALAGNLTRVALPPKMRFGW